VARYFYSFVDSYKNYFLWRINPPLMLARDIALWISALLVAPAVVALVIKLILPKRKLLISGRAIVFLIATLALGPGLLVNVVRKVQWGRPPPCDLRLCGGTHLFVPWGAPRGVCPSNCVFVCGVVSGAFGPLPPAALAPPQWRALAYGAALALGTGVAAIRVMAGAHFLSDVIFAGIFTYLLILITYALIYRLPRTRLSDADCEQAIERPTLPAYNFFTGLLSSRPK